MKNRSIGAQLGRRFPEIPAVADEQRPQPHTSVGIEIEVEGVRVRDMPFKRWSIDDTEGSLINGVELVSDPVFGTAITDALNEMDEFLKDQEPYFSFRTSIHIHVNVLDMDSPQLKRLIQLGVLYEPALFHLHQDRLHNPFCVPTQESVLIQRSLGTLIEYLDRNRAGSFRESLRSKYSACNINSLRKFGTFEYRHMGGTSDMGAVSNWINILLQMKAAALDTTISIYDTRAIWGKMIDQIHITPAQIERGKHLINYIETWR